MEDVLYPIGSIVEVENTNDEVEKCLIIGHRVINHFSMKAWDYISVPYPKGFKRYFKPSKEFDYDDYFYFNHYDINKMIYQSAVDINKDEG